MHGCSGPDECFAKLNGPERIETNVNAVLLVAKKQVVMQAAEVCQTQVTVFGTHLASVPDPDKSEEDFRKYMRANGTTPEDFFCNEEEALRGADQG